MTSTQVVEHQRLSPITVVIFKITLIQISTRGSLPYIGYIGMHQRVWVLTIYQYYCFILFLCYTCRYELKYAKAFRLIIFLCYKLSHKNPRLVLFNIFIKPLSSCPRLPVGSSFVCLLVLCNKSFKPCMNQNVLICSLQT